MHRGVRAKYYEKAQQKNKRILGHICGIMILFGVLFIGVMFTKWGWWLDIYVLSGIGECLRLPTWFSLAALKIYWLIVIVLFVVAMYYPEE